MTRLRTALVAVVLALVSIGLAPGSPAHAADSSTLTGTVRAHDSTLITDSSQYRLSVWAVDGTYLADGAINRTTGLYTTSAFPTQPVKIRVYYVGDRIDTLPYTWAGVGQTVGTATEWATTPGVTTIDVTLIRAATISGTVSTDSSAPLGTIDISVTALGVIGLEVPFGSVTGDDPTFTIGPFPPATVTLILRSQNQLWDERQLSVTIPAYGSSVTQNVTLVRAASIEGTVTVGGLAPGGGPTGRVDLLSADGSETRASATVAADGSYRIRQVEPGSYRVCIPAIVTFNWKPTCVMDGASPRVFTIAAHQVVTAADIQTQQWGGIVGGLKIGVGSGATSSSNEAHLYRQTPGGYVYVRSTATVGIDGEYRFGGIEPGVYALEFVDNTGAHSREYWQAQRYWAGHDTVTVTAGASVHLGPTVLDPRDYDVTRVAGADRFGTTAQVLRERFADGQSVPVIYVANGTNYPDALSAGPAAAHFGGALVTVQSTSIPAAIAAELARINPERIVVVGGTGAVSSAVEAQLRQYVDSPSDVTRIGGADRYATSRLIVADAWRGVGADSAFLASGLNFPDALAAVPAAGRWDAPVILVPGNASSLDNATRTLLGTLGVEGIHIVGGTASISYGIQSSVQSIVGDQWVRYAGVNRFATAVLVSMANFSVADRAYLASGMNFADALAAGPSAAAEGAPIYLTDGSCIYDFVMSDIEGVGANGIVVLGGKLAQSNAITNLTVCASGFVAGEISQGESAASGPLRLPEGVTR